VSKFTDATKTSLSLQIMAGLTLVGFLTFLAWMTAPRPTPPTPEEQARHAVQETLDVAGNELRYLRDQRQALDLAAHSIIGNTHAWHKVNEEPPPMAVAQWIKERNDVNNAVLFAYNRIAEFRHELDVTEIELSTEYERIARTLSTGTAIELQPAADGVAQRARHAAQQTKEYIRELQRPRTSTVRTMKMPSTRLSWIMLLMIFAPCTFGQDRGGREQRQIELYQEALRSAADQLSVSPTDPTAVDVAALGQYALAQLGRAANPAATDARDRFASGLYKSADRFSRKLAETLTNDVGALDWQQRRGSARIP
jgi:hypothetical protein